MVLESCTVLQQRDEVGIFLADLWKIFTGIKQGYMEDIYRDKTRVYGRYLQG